MGVDQPDDADVPPDEHADHRDDQDANGGGRAARSGGAQAETRYRQECYVDLRVAVTAERSVAARQTAAEEQAAAEKWDEKVEESRWMWTEYQRKWPPPNAPPADKSDDDPGSWCGEGNRSLNRATTAALKQHATVSRTASGTRSPQMRAIESQDPDRQLIGFGNRLKSRDRIKEKVYGTMKDLDRSPEQAVSLVPDAIRFTFQYREAGYTQGVWADIGRLKDRGFKLDKLKNSWSGEQYKGINSQWIEPDTGRRFEVQFHTRISFEAKQLTHDAYKRLRAGQCPDKFEQMVLEAFQRKVTADVPVPPGAADIPDYP